MTEINTNISNEPKAESCCCTSRHPSTNVKKAAVIKNATGILPSILLNILIAFFPKCPICWAVYMSMLGSLGLSKLPYMKWILPVLLVLLCIHLIMLFIRAKQTGYLPFALSVAGAMFIIFFRTFFMAEKWLLITGMILTVSGSLLNSFSNIRLLLSHQNINSKNNQHVTIKTIKST